MVLGKIKCRGKIGITNFIYKQYSKDIVVEFTDGSKQAIEFNSVDACTVAFDDIWYSLITKGYCDLDRINLQTGMVIG